MPFSHLESFEASYKEITAYDTQATLQHERCGAVRGQC